MAVRIKKKLNGVSLSKNKHFSGSEAIENIPEPEKIYLPMNMHIGKPAKVVVSIGQFVRVGTLIGKKDGMISANIHSSISGVVEKIEERMIGTKRSVVVVIKNDYKNMIEIPSYLNGNLVENILTNGIVGMGGAGFPTDVKFHLRKHQKIETLVINAVECEPFATADRRIIIENTKEFLENIQLIQKLSNSDSCVIAIENSSKEAIINLIK